MDLLLNQHTQNHRGHGKLSPFNTIQCDWVYHIVFGKTLVMSKRTEALGTEHKVSVNRSVPSGREHAN